MAAGCQDTAHLSITVDLPTSAIREIFSGMTRVTRTSEQSSVLSEVLNSPLVPALATGLFNLLVRNRAANVPTQKVPTTKSEGDVKSTEDDTRGVKPEKDDLPMGVTGTVPSLNPLIFSNSSTGPSIPNVGAALINMAGNSLLGVMEQLTNTACGNN